MSKEITITSLLNAVKHRLKIDRVAEVSRADHVHDIDETVVPRGSLIHEYLAWAFR